MTFQDWAALTLTILSIVVLLAGGIKFLVKHYLSELKPNHGSSMRDEIKVIRSEMQAVKDHQTEADILRREMNAKLDKMYLVLLDHIAKNPRE